MPFRALDRQGGMLRVATRFPARSCPRLVAPRYERERIPSRFQTPAARIAFAQDRARSLLQLFKDGMNAYPPKPIRRVRGIGLDAVSDGMPIRALARWIVLRKLVAPLPVGQQKHQAAQRGLRVPRPRKES